MRTMKQGAMMKRDSKHALEGDESAKEMQVSQALSDLKEPTRWKAGGAAFWVGRTSHAKALGQEQASLCFFRNGNQAIIAAGL